MQRMQLKHARRSRVRCLLVLRDECMHRARVAALRLHECGDAHSVHESEQRGQLGQVQLAVRLQRVREVQALPRGTIDERGDDDRTSGAGRQGRGHGREGGVHHGVG